MLSAFRAKSLSLSPSEARLSSPNGLLEEGVIEHLFSLLPTQTGYCIEIGAGNGTDFSLTRRLVQERGWGALLVEACPKLSLALREKHAANEKVRIIGEAIEPDQIKGYFQTHGVPREPDLLCIDIDGMDYYVWEALGDYRPSIVCIEYNASYPPPHEFVATYRTGFRWSGDDHFGASIQSLVNLGKQKGYELVHVMSHGDNLFFVREEWLAKLPVTKNDPATMYQVPQYGRYGRSPNGKGHPASALDASVLQRAWYRLNYFLMTPLRRLAGGRV